MDKKWWQSKTKWGALLVGAAQVLPLIPQAAPYAQAVMAVGTVLGGFGVRDALGAPAAK